MLFQGSFIRVFDNSGARLVKCIHVCRFAVACPGSTVIVVVRVAYPHRRIKKGDIFRAVIVQLRAPAYRFSNYFTIFGQNAVVLLKKGDDVPLSTRVSRFVFEEVRTRGFYRLSALALGLL